MKKNLSLSEKLFTSLRSAEGNVGQKNCNNQKKSSSVTAIYKFVKLIKAHVLYSKKIANTKQSIETATRIVKSKNDLEAGIVATATTERSVKKKEKTLKVLAEEIIFLIYKRLLSFEIAFNQINKNIRGNQLVIRGNLSYRKIALTLILSLSLLTNSQPLTVIAEESTSSASLSSTSSATLDSSPTPTTPSLTPSPEDRVFTPPPWLTLTPLPTLSPTLVPSTFPALVQTSASSASLRRETVLQPLPKKDYRADESVTAFLFITQGTDFTAELYNPQDEKQNITIDQQPNADFTTLRIAPSLEFRPGKHTLKITDSTGNLLSQEFNWGMINFNTDSSIYRPGESASFSLGVTDEKGAIVCDANISLIIKNEEELSTNNGKVLPNPDCAKHDFNLKPDYQATYKIPEEAGTYEVKISAMIKDQSYQIEDSFEVEPDGPFRITRSYPTRLTSPRWHPMNFTLTAQTDFTGTVSERLPASVDISPVDDPTLSSYDSLSYVNTNLNTGSLLGVTIPSLQAPFAGSQSATLGFGENLEDPLLIRLYSQFNLSGHDGVDFDLAPETPVLAADSGMVSLAGDGDYGTTVAIDHAWGRSYYGHLSKLDIVFGQRVERGERIGLSGNTGLSTGAHLHFGIKPKRFDKNNGYYGKINPLPYLDQIGQISPISPISQINQTGKAKLVSWNFSLKKGESQTFGYQMKAPTQEASSYLAGPIEIKSEIRNPKSETNSNTQNPNEQKSFENSNLDYSKIVSSFELRASNFTESRLWQMTTDVIPQAPGASFPENTEQFPMELIDPKLFDVPEDYSFVKAELDKELKGRYTNLLLEKTSPGFQMVYATSSGQLKGVRLTLDIQAPNTLRAGQSTNDLPEGGSVKSNQVRRDGILPNVDYIYETYDGYINQKIILKNDTTQKDFQFILEKGQSTINNQQSTIDTSDNLVAEDYFGHVLIKDKVTDEEFFLFRFPQGIDAKNQRIDYKYKIENGRLILYPARAWQLQKAVYPITIYAPMNVVAWDKVLIKVGDNCPDGEKNCDKDGDIEGIRPEGWHFGTKDLKKNAVVKIPKLTREEKQNFLSKTPEKQAIDDAGNLARYGIDYTKLIDPTTLKKIRNPEITSPNINAVGKKGVILKKQVLTDSVIRQEVRFSVLTDNRSLLTKIKDFFVKQVYAATDVNTIGSAAGRDYSSVTNWEATECSGTLTDIEQGVMYNDSAHTDLPNFTGCTPSATAYLHLTVAPSDRHNGTATGAYFDANDSLGTQTDIITVSLQFTRIDWVRFTNFSGKDFGRAISMDAADITIANVIVHNFADATVNVDGIRNLGFTGGIIRNTLVYDGDRTGIFSTTGGSTSIYNSTVDGLIDGYNDGAGVMAITNSIAMNTSSDDFDVNTAGSSLDYNLCEDNASDCGASQTNVTCNNCLFNKTRANQFVSVTAGSEDFHLKSGADAIDAGTNLSTSFVNDIDDTVRTYGPWDIGADEFPSRLIDSLMRHGKYFGDSSGSEQPFTF